APASYRVDRRPVASQDLIDAAAERLVRAERPAVWAGRGIITANATGAMMSLAESAGLPVVTTFNGIAAAPGDHPPAFGPRSRCGTRLSRGILTEADCLVVVGNSLNAASTSRWTLPLTENLIHIDLDPLIIGRNYPVALGIVGDAADALQSLRK